MGWTASKEIRLFACRTMLIGSMLGSAPLLFASSDFLDPKSYELNLAFGGIQQVAVVHNVSQQRETLPENCETSGESWRCSTPYPEPGVFILSPSLRSRMAFDQVINHSFQTRFYPVYSHKSSERDPQNPATAPIYSTDIRVYGFGSNLMYDVAIVTPQWCPDLIFGVGASINAVSADIALNESRHRVRALPIGLALEWEVVWLRSSRGTIRSGWYLGVVESPVHMTEKSSAIKAKSLALNRSGIDIIQWSMPLDELMHEGSRIWD